MEIGKVRQGACRNKEFLFPGSVFVMLEEEEEEDEEVEDEVEVVEEVG